MPFVPFSRRALGAAALCFLLHRLAGHGAAAEPAPVPLDTLPGLTITGAAAPGSQYQLPTPAQAITATQIEETVNAVDVEDALKYLPSVFVRKRNDGDTQAVLATRTWGLNSSARSLVYADGVLLSALIANNNTIGAPRWGLVAPVEIQRIDVRYGPFAAAYPGNSMGAVVEMTTRMPEHFEAAVDQTEALQSFSLYTTRGSYPVGQTAVTVGNRSGKWSFWISADGEDSRTQPLTFVTASVPPPGTSGAFVAWNKQGQPADVLGAAGLLHADIASATVKAAYDFAPGVRATYTLGLWRNDTASAVQTYLRDAAGRPTFAGQAGFASGYYGLVEEHTLQSFSVRSEGRGDWDWQVVGSLYDFDKDTQKSPATAADRGTALSAAGKVALLGGTGWSTLDAKAAWHPSGRGGPQELSFGAHDDAYALVNPTYTTPDWQAARIFSSLSTAGDGDTETRAVWVQDAWQGLPQLKATVGGRYEAWRAFDGLNVSEGTRVAQPRESAADFSPKATLAWTPAKAWTVTALAGKAYRYPTAGELYQLVSTGTTFTSPNPNLQPEKVWSEELRAERALPNGSLRISFFQEDVRDALISQFAPLVAGSPTPYQFVMNVDRIRNRGIEAYVDRDHVLFSGLELSGSVTYVDSKILADRGQGQFAAAAGKRSPYVPDWRATLVATYRPAPAVAFSLAGRYSGREYSTVDNSDVNPNTFGGFDSFFVLDAHVHWSLSPRWALAGGADNLLDRKYFLYHPFPQRTLVAEVKYGF